MYTVLLLLMAICTSLAQYYPDSRIENEDPELSPADVEEPGCPKIDNLRNTTMKEMLGQWHLPYMSDHWVRYMAKSMHGKFMKRSSMGRTCIKVNVKELTQGTPNNTEATIWLQSKCPRTASEWSLACAPSETLNSKWYCNDLKGRTHDDDSYIYVADTDEKTWALVIRCFPNNGVSWAIFSKIKRLENALVKSLLAKVESLGFKIFNVVEIPYEKCMTKP